MTYQHNGRRIKYKAEKTQRKFVLFFFVLVFAVAGIGRLSTKGTVLFLCDMQDKFRPNIFQFTNIVSNAARLLQVGYTHSHTTISDKIL